MSVARFHRRDFLAGAGVSLALPGRLLALPPRGFTHGLASGEPTTTSALLWTRYVGAADPVPLVAEISATKDFRRIAARGTALAEAASDWTARVTLTGLRPGGRWFYRFRSPAGDYSEIGRTRTFAEGDAGSLSVGVFCCSNLPFGWFNAYGHAAADPSLDLAIHIGDYIYEYPRGTYPSAAETVPGRVHEPAGATVALDAYRTRYAAYRLDPDLRALHAAKPMLAVWDDHEFADNADRDDAYGHDPKTQGSWSARKIAATRAWREWMPVSHDDRPEERDAGSLASFISLETRITGRMPPVDFYPLRDTPGDLRAKLAAWRDSTWRNPGQRMLGEAQEATIVRALHDAPRRTRWQILVNSVPMGYCLIPTAAREWPVTGGEAGRREIDLLINCADLGIPFNMDNWNGFPAQRARLLQAAQDANARLIVLSGDSHNAWAYRLRERGRPAAVELSVPSVTSPGFDAWFPKEDPAAIARALVARNDELVWCDTARRGYGRLDLTAERATLRWLFTDPIRQRSARAVEGYRLELTA